MSNGGDYQGHWEDTPGIPYSTDYSQIKSGVRPTLRACQYWIKGLSGICVYWVNGDPGNCVYEEKDSKGQRIYPSGWNNGHCDFLGRRSFCDRYESSAEDLEQYMCVAPDPFRTGLIKEVKAGMPLRLTGERTAVPKSDIRGYNEGDGGIGQCDGYGQGKGSAGFGLNTGSDEYKKLPVVCPYYRPWSMGFGAVKPKTTDISKATKDTEGRYIVDEREKIEEQMPISFRIFNMRSKCQKCAYWDKDYGSEFVFEPGGLCLEEEAEGYPFDANDRLTLCTCTDTKSDKYCTRSDQAYEILLENVWAKSGSVICNGAKPECPCYTGDWVYCIDEKMMDGDAVSAQQIMELRFWMKDWPSQEVYDGFFERKPNRDDPSTADIYTFVKWKRLGAPSDAIMEGKQIHMCQPAPVWKKEFDPNLYLTVTDISYPKLGVDDGTSAPGQVSFPSLVRDIEYNVPYPLDIIYPYPSKCFDESVCTERSDDVCIKRSNSMDGDSIRIIGYTVRGKTVYAFNTYYTGFGSVRELEYYDDVFSMPNDIKEDFFRRLKIFIEDLIENKPEYICCGTSVAGINADSGIFNIGPLPLKYQRENTIIICVDFGGGWEFKRRDVWSQWYGGVVVQTGFNYTPTGHTFVPKYFWPSASASGRLVPFSGSNFYECCTHLDKVFSVYSYRYYSSHGSINYYAYCVKKVTVENKEINENSWARIGQSSLIWVEIPDINLNYIFEWEVVEGTMTFNGVEKDVCGGTTVKMKIKYPTSWAAGQKYIPANVCILEPEDEKPRGFLPNKWILKLTYKYITLSSSISDDEELIFPPVFDEYTILQDSPYNVSSMSDDLSFTITNIMKGTVAIMGYFTDENGRLISAMATKMLTQVTRVECRNVEISYSYSAEGKQYLLQPSRGFRIWIGPDKLTGETRTHSETPPCGDHKCPNPRMCIGPMWYPFLDCDNVNWYTWYAAGVSCTRPYESKPEEEGYGTFFRPDYRYCGPHEYNASVGMGSAIWASECGVRWSYYYSDATGPVTFTGYANIVGAIDVPFYRAAGWTLPPFGYGGREIVRKFLSQDFQSHLSYEHGPPRRKSQWMPVIPDQPSFFMSFNAFDQESLGSTYVAADYFSYTHQLNFLCSDLIKEEVDYTTRLRFEDALGTRHETFCSYPPPIDAGPGGWPKAGYLYFKDEKSVWAWQERWKPIERRVSDICLTFVSEVVKPNYKVGYSKDEHRYICEEGIHTLEYKAPQLDADGNYMVAPSISLDGVFPRYFEILYDENDYNDKCVEWMNENDGQIDGSGGNTEPNIYGQTSGSDWNHFKDSDTGGLLFDAEAVGTTSEAADAGREIVVESDSEGDTKKYYNRGVIVNVPRNRLHYLPYEEFLIEGPKFAKESSWCDGSEALVIEDLNVCVSKVVVTGVLGRDIVGGECVELREPNVTIESFEPANWIFRSCVDESNANGTVSIEKVSDEFVITMKILPTVIRMLTKRDQKISITIEPLASYCTKVTKIECFRANYIDKTETIKTWERKYIMSEGSADGFRSANGPDEILKYAEDRDIAGQYLPLLSSLEPYEYMDKMRIGGAGRGHLLGDDTPLPINMGNLHQIEAEEQPALYDAAYKLDPSGVDEIIYTIICPVKFKQFFDDENISCGMGGDVKFSAEKVTWAKHYASGSLKQYDFWRPGGHKFQWSDYTYKGKCYVMSFWDEDIYSGEAVHVNHGGVTSVMDPGNALRSGRHYHLQAYVVRNIILMGNTGFHEHLIDGFWK